MTILLPADLEPFAVIDPAKAAAMIEDAEAQAALAAPCITDSEFLADQVLVAAARSVIRGAILRWNEAGSGAVTQVGAGSFQQTIDTRQQRRGMFWPSELSQLRDLCVKFRGEVPASAFGVDTATSVGSVHLPWCSAMFGAVYCSCGADIAGRPIYENAPGL